MPRLASNPAHPAFVSQLFFTDYVRFSVTVTPGVNAPTLDPSEPFNLKSNLMDRL
jgi:hypothetical protein